MDQKTQMSQRDAFNDPTLNDPTRNLRKLGASWISYESHFPTSMGAVSAFDNLALDRRISLIFVTRHPLTRLLSSDDQNKKLREAECKQINEEVVAAGGSDTFDCSQAGTKSEWPVGPRSNPTKECELVWRNQQWAAEKANYSLRWIGGSHGKLNLKYLHEAKRRVGLGDVVITTHDTLQSICVMCKATAVCIATQERAKRGRQIFIS